MDRDARDDGYRSVPARAFSFSPKITSCKQVMAADQIRPVPRTACPFHTASVAMSVQPHLDSQVSTGWPNWQQNGNRIGNISPMRL